MNSKRNSIIVVLALVLLTFGVSSIISAKNTPLEPITQTPTPVINTQKAQIEVVFVLDTTGSMSGLIQAAKQKIWSIANTLSSADPAPDIKMGLIGYRDKGDKYVTSFTQLTDDIDAVYTRLMTFNAAGGGDTPEDVNLALYEAIHNIQWSRSDSVYRVVFLVGDAPPHMDYKDQVKYQTSCTVAVQNGIVINTVQCGNMPATEQFWQSIAKLGRGEYFRVAQSGGAVMYDTPYDDDIAQLSHSLDSTRIYYGTPEELAQQKDREKAADEIYSKADSSAIAKRSIFNASRGGIKNFLGQKELVSSLESDDIDLKEIKKENLPEIMQPMSMDEKKAYVEEQKLLREKTQKEIQVLSQKRKAFIEEKIDKEKDKGKTSLDSQLYKCIQSQAAEKEIIYSEGPEY